MDKGLFQMFAFIAVLMVVGVAATAIMVASQKGSAPAANGAIATNGNGGTTEA